MQKYGKSWPIANFRFDLEFAVILNRMGKTFPHSHSWRGENLKNVPVLRELCHIRGSSVCITSGTLENNLYDTVIDRS